jgi:hypothetical protein
MDGQPAGLLSAYLHRETKYLVTFSPSDGGTATRAWSGGDVSTLRGAATTCPLQISCRIRRRLLKAPVSPAPHGQHFHSAQAAQHRPAQFLIFIAVHRGRERLQVF